MTMSMTKKKKEIAESECAVTWGGWGKGTSLATSYTCNWPCASPTAKCDPLPFQRNLDNATAGAVDVDAAAAATEDEAVAVAVVAAVDGGARSNPWVDSGWEVRAPTS